MRAKDSAGKIDQGGQGGRVRDLKVGGGGRRGILLDGEMSEDAMIALLRTDRATEWANGRMGETIDRLSNAQVHVWWVMSNGQHG